MKLAHAVIATQPSAAATPRVSPGAGDAGIGVRRRREGEANSPRPDRRVVTRSAEGRDATVRNITLAGHRRSTPVPTYVAQANVRRLGWAHSHPRVAGSLRGRDGLWARSHNHME